MNQEPDILPSTSIKVVTPEGVMFVHIIEHPPSMPYKIDITIGKAGSAIQAWASAFARISSVCLRNGIPLSALVEEISGLNSDRVTLSNGRNVRSGPDGIAQAILIYIESKKPKVITRHRRRGPTFFGEEV